MPVALLVRLCGGRYDAASIRPDQREWPPHPARVFCALAASATDKKDWAALRWLEASGEPEVWASPQSASTARSGFVVTNARHGKSGGSQSWPARTNGTRRRTGSVPSVPEFAVAWPDAEPESECLAVLTGLARRVPYIGRSTSPAVVTVSTCVPGERTEWARWVPAAAGAPGTDDLRVPYPGYSARLQAAYAGGRRAWEVSRTIPYAAADASLPNAKAAVPRPFADLLVFGFERRAARFDGRSLLSLTVPLRKALMSRIGTDIPAQVSGHGANGRTHVGYLALPDVGHEHADGHVLGVALAVPGGMSGPDMARLAAASIDNPLQRLTIRRGYEVGVRYDPFRSSPQGLLPERWIGSDSGGSRDWVTVTPMMLDRYPRRNTTEISEVAWSLRNAGYPEPVSIEVSPTAMIPGAIHRADVSAAPRHGSRRPMLHAKVSFSQPVTGPVVAGALRYFGLGLFVPHGRRS